jgi:hypothetical protein
MELHDNLSSTKGDLMSCIAASVKSCEYYSVKVRDFVDTMEAGTELAEDKQRHEDFVKSLGGLPPSSFQSLEVDAAMAALKFMGEARERLRPGSMDAMEAGILEALMKFWHAADEEWGAPGGRMTVECIQGMQRLFMEMSLCFPTNAQVHAAVEGITNYLRKATCFEKAEATRAMADEILASDRTPTSKEYLDKCEALEKHLQQFQGVVLQSPEMKASLSKLRDVMLQSAMQELPQPGLHTVFKALLQVQGIVDPNMSECSSAVHIANQAHMCIQGLAQARGGRESAQTCKAARKELDKRVALAGVMLTQVQKVKGMLGEAGQLAADALADSHKQGTEYLKEQYMQDKLGALAALRDAHKELKPLQGGMADGTSWDTDLDDPACWEKLVAHAQQTILLADAEKLVAAMRRCEEVPHCCSDAACSVMLEKPMCALSESFVACLGPTPQRLPPINSCIIYASMLLFFAHVV